MTSQKQPTAPEMLVGRYVLTDVVRRGAQATVTKALDTRTSKFVAVKRVKFGPDDQRAREAFQREAHMLQTLTHDNILQLIEVDRDQDGNWFLILEWIPDNLEDVIEREGAMGWSMFWARYGRPLLEAVGFGQKKRIAHRDIKPKNVLVTESGVAKLADYGIAKLLDDGGAWKPLSGVTFRFDHTPGYTPSKPEDEQFAFSRDCFAFAAVAVSCVAGRVLNSEADIKAALQEAALPEFVRPILERCLSDDPADRPPLGSVLKEQIEQAEVAANWGLVSALTIHLILSGQVLGSLEKRLDLQTQSDIERFILAELSEVCGILAKQDDGHGGPAHIELIGATWKFDGLVAGLSREALHITRASEIGAGLASELREVAAVRPLSFSFVRPKDAQRAGRELLLLVAESLSAQLAFAAEREARAAQRIFRVWRGYLRDRADLEAKRGNAIRYVDRQVSGDRVVFTTEIAQKEEIIGQDRVVHVTSGPIGGKITAVSFNRVVMDVILGDPSRLLRRGEIAINTIAAQKALTHQSQAIDAVVFDRSVSQRLKAVILDPRSSTPAVPVAGVTLADKDFDQEKVDILAKALGVQDVLAIVGAARHG